MNIKGYARDNFLQPEFIKFLLVGAGNTFLGYVIFFILIYWFGVNYVVAMISEYAIIIVVSYFLNKLWIFKTATSPGKEIIKFVSVYFLSFAANFFLMHVAVDILKYSALISQLIVLSVLAVISFIGHKGWTFSR